jgi:hypothetical protein
MDCKCHNTSGYCQCLVVDSNCVRVQQANPWQLELVADPIDTNIVEATSLGLQAVLPNSFTQPASAGVYNSEKEFIQLELGPVTAIPFDVSVWDTQGAFSTARNVRRLYFADDGVFAAHGSVMFLLQALTTTLRAGPRFSNGAWWVNSATRNTAATGNTFINAGGIESVSADQYVELLAQTTISVAQLTDEPLYLRASLSMTRLGTL